jgi:hypothetical protein
VGDTKRVRNVIEFQRIEIANDNRDRRVFENKYLFYGNFCGQNVAKPFTAC